MKTILIRCDGRKNLGMGHLNRCLIAANFLLKERNIKSIFLVREDSHAKSFLSERRGDGENEFIFFPSGLSREEETSLLLNTCKNKNAELILLDLLEEHLSVEFLNSLRRANLPLVSIVDESQYLEIGTDLILNGNPNQVGLDYSLAKGKYLRGPKYFIMSDAYSDIELRENRVEIDSVLVTVGGSDHNDLLFGLLSTLEEVSSIKRIEIVTSKGTGYIDRLREEISKSKKEVNLHIDINGLSQIWSTVDFSITAGGNTLFERIASLTPGLTLCQLERQMEIANKFEELGVNKNIGYGPRVEKLDMLDCIEAFVKNGAARDLQIKKSEELGLGKGLSLFADELCKLIEE